MVGLAITVAVCLALSNTVRAQELLSNNSFETGDFSGWTLSGNLGFSGIGGGPHTGTYAAIFGPVGSPGYISQTVATTPGSIYDISWWLFSDGFTPNEFQVSAGGSVLIDHSNLPASLYTKMTTSFTAEAASTEVKFGFRDDPGFFRFDDASVRLSESLPLPATATPEFGSVISLGALLAASSIGMVIRRWRRPISK